MSGARRFLAHALGDYVVQSNWLAQTKTTSHKTAVIHASTYAASERQDRCRALWSEDHAFEPLPAARARKGQHDIAPVVVELKSLASPAPIRDTTQEEEA